MTEEELVQSIEGGERPGVEFKSARSRKDGSFTEVVRAILGMANRRDGGTIILGVDDNGNAPGLTAPQVDTWRQADHVRQAVAPYADPFVYLDVHIHTIAGPGVLLGRTFVVLSVNEFDDDPVLCAKAALNKQGKELLRVGACYVRGNHMPATTEIATHAQFRQLLELAIEKGVRKFLKRARAAGLPIDGNQAPAVADQQQFDAQAAPFDE